MKGKNHHSIDFECFKINQQYWGIISNFLENGFGFCLQHEGKMFSEAVSIFRSMQ